MEKLKTKVLKSKSSNATISKETYGKQDKKSRSNAELPPEQGSLKKRGVYVEKKLTKTSMTEDINMPKKPKVTRRPDRKRFLNSILTILSQSTTGTQFPDQDEKSNKTKIKKKKIYEENVMGDLNAAKKQPKYRSKVLNEYNVDMDNVVILQSKKEIIQTPSNYSQRQSKDKVSIKWSDLIPPSAPIVQQKGSDITVIETKENEKQVSLIDHIESGKGEYSKTLTPFIQTTDEPMTLVANVKEKDDDKLYDFFVDLLESTFNVYNVKTEPEVKNVVSKLALPTNESVTKNFNVETSKHCVNDDENSAIDDEPRIEYNPKFCCQISDDWDDKLLDNCKCLSLRAISPEIPLVQSKVRRKLKSESFTCKKKNPTQVTRSYIYQNFPTKKTLKKDRKKNLLNLLKEQLSMETEYEPPKNFFESLQVMAKYKKRCQKSIHFMEPTKKPSEGNLHDCMFKRRNILSTTGKTFRKFRPKTDKSLRNFLRKPTVFNLNKPRINFSSYSDAESRLSLAVYNYDYDYDVTQNNNFNYKQDASEDTFEPATFSSESTVFGSVIQTDGSYADW